MKKPLAFKLMVDPKDVRRAVAIITGEALSDEELEEKFFTREPVEIDLSEVDPNDAFSMNAAFVVLMIGEQEKPEKRKGKFQKYLEEAEKLKNKN